MQLILKISHPSADCKFQRFKVDRLVKSRIGERHCLFREQGFDTGGVKNSKLFEELATSSWNLVAGVETPERGAPERAKLTFYESIKVSGFRWQRTEDRKKMTRGRSLNSYSAKSAEDGA